MTKIDLPFGGFLIRKLSSVYSVLVKTPPVREKSFYSLKCVGVFSTIEQARKYVGEYLCVEEL